MKRALPLFFLFLASAALAESGAYQVEVIIFRNLAVTAEAAPVEELRGFSQLPDLLEPAATPDFGAPGLATVDEPGLETRQAIEETEDMAPASAIPRPDLPDDLRLVSEKSPAMDDAWRRLRGSRNYRPLLYAGWQQNRVDYYPPMRVHGPEVIDTRLRAPTGIMVADLTAADPLAAYRSVFYRLDGSVQLRRSRFLHVNLDLEYRETGPGLQPGWELVDAAPGAQPRATDERYTVFALRQNRQVRTGQIHYFDTPQFGALVLVTAIASEAPTGLDLSP